MLIDKAINKYGIDNFEVEILKCNLSTQCLLNFWECYYIDLFDTLAKNGRRRSFINDKKYNYE